MADALVPFQSNYLIPHNTNTASIVICLPGNSMGYSGSATLALTDDALFLTTPDGSYEKLPFQIIRRVRPQNFTGIVIPMELGGAARLVNPLEAAGVIVEYQFAGNFISTLTFLTINPNNAQAWAGKIARAVVVWNVKNQTPPTKGTYHMART